MPTGIYDHKKVAPLQERFNRLVQVATDSGCWLWQGAINSDGYGNMRDENGKVESSHRIAWRIFKGQIPPKMSVLHKCDNPPCANPDHLFLGFQVDNNIDCYKKGRRNNNGVNNPRCKLTKETVDKIRIDGRVSHIIASEYGISSSHVRRLKNGKDWANP